MASDSIVSAEPQSQGERGDAGVSPRTVRAWPSHATCSVKGGDHWECTRRVSLRELEQAPTAALVLLDDIADDFAEVARLSSAVSDWAMLACIPSLSTSGFDIDVRMDSDGICASFGGLNQEFERIATAMVWVRRALSRQYQLRIVGIGGLAREWRLEPISATPPATADCLSSGHPILMRRWRKTSLTYRRNRLLDLAVSGNNDN